VRGSVRLLGLLAAGALGLALFGCGPVEYLDQVTRRATTAFAAAQKVDAEKLAPYEFYTAQEYLHKSREVAGYARFQLAIDYGRISEEAAVKARALSLEKKSQPSAEPAITPPAGTAAP
jgi:hypothetical protein